MNHQDKNRFAELMAWLAQTFQAEISSVDIENYWRFLNRFPLVDVEQAIVNYCLHPEGHRFMPKPGEIIIHIEGNSTGLAMQAWTKILRAMQHIGCYHTVIFDDPIIHAVLYDMGGWIKLNAMLEKEIHFYAREFEKRYLSYLTHKPAQYPKQLTGIIDATNAACGYLSTTKPLLIGDEKRALLVYQQGKDASTLLKYTPLPFNALEQTEISSHLLMEKSNEQNV